MHPKIFAVVLTWNNYKDTKECIESLLRSSLLLSNIIVVDNGSRDGSIEKLKGDFRDFSLLHFIKNPMNYGFAKGVNVGIQYALSRGAEYVFLLNNDAIIAGDCIRVLYDTLIDDAQAGIAGPRIFYHSESQRIWLGGGYFSYLKTGIVVPEKNKLVDKCNEDIKPVTFLTGCAVLIKREVFEKVGLYFLYDEDLDFCLRASRARFKLLYVPSAKVWHKIETIAKDRTSPLVMYHMARGRIIGLRKNFQWFYLLYGLIIHLLLYTPFRFLQVIRGSQSLIKSTWAWLHGTWAGIWQPLQPRSDRNGA